MRDKTRLEALEPRVPAARPGRLAFLLAVLALVGCGSRQTLQQGGDDAGLVPPVEGGTGEDAPNPSVADGGAGADGAVTDGAITDARSGDGGDGPDDAGGRPDSSWWPFDWGGANSDRGADAAGTTDGPGVAPGQRCATAQPLVLTGGKASVTGDTSGAVNEFGTAIDCGTYTSRASTNKFVAAGGQHYYRVAVTPGQSYKVTLAPKFGSALLYAFTGCDPAQINADCGSGGKTGDVTPHVMKFSPQRVLVLTAATSSLLLAVDSALPNNAGPYTLTVEQFAPATNGACAAAQPLTLVGGKATATGDLCGITAEFPGQITCGIQPLDGPQLYYRAQLEAGTVYALRVTSSGSAEVPWPLVLAVFGDDCDPVQINADCASGGQSGAVTGGYFSPPELVGYFSPQVSGLYRLMVRQPVNLIPDPLPCVTFGLTVEAIAPPANSTCAAAKPLPLVGGAASSSDPIGGVFDELGAQVSCGASSPLRLPQLYYQVDLEASQSYRFEAQLVPSTPTSKPSLPIGVALALFSDSCAPAQIEADCSSDGVSGALWVPPTPSSPPRKTHGVFAPVVSGTYRVAAELWLAYPVVPPGATPMPFVDASIALSVEAFTPAPNGRCAAAEPVTLAAGGGLIEADTSGVGNEFGTLVNCGKAAPMAGPQLYYRLSLIAGKQYDFDVDTATTAFPASLYIFNETCDPAQINSACGSGGAGGALGMFGGMSFTPAASGDYILVIDSREPGDFGAVTVTIKAS